MDSVANRRFAMSGDERQPCIQTDMDDHSSWLDQPAQARLQWQTTEAAGADRKPFAARSIVQYRAMFDRFVRHMAAHQVNLATFSTQTLEAFFADVENRCAPGTITRLRYVKVLDRLCRHLVEIGLRTVLPDDACNGLVPHNAASAASFFSRSGLSPATATNTAAVCGPTPNRSEPPGMLPRQLVKHGIERVQFLGQRQPALRQQTQRRGQRLQHRRGAARNAFGSLGLQKTFADVLRRAHQSKARN
ncbi:hypothetical protein B0G80_7448 [Paraburkholderia sp. BL6669N2]|nr:hypothetical protein B0G80_7448 [Paraburkholderia sp. BL6669N2]